MRIALLLLLALGLGLAGWLAARAKAWSFRKSGATRLAALPSYHGWYLALWVAVPMVLFVHGGPWARDAYGFNGMHQLLANRGYAEGPGPVVGRRDLLITTTGGARFLRRIGAASVLDATRELVTIDSALGTTLAPEAFQRISFLRLVRLDTDHVEIAHLTDEVAEAVLPLRSLREEP